MPLTPEYIPTKQPVISKRSKAAASDEMLHHLAFDNSFQANIITTVSDGKIIIVNTTACKLLGYTKKELLTKSRSTIFDINEGSFKKMLKQRLVEGKSKALVTAIKKSGKRLTCEITSAIFKDEYGIEKAITTIVDMSQSIRKQKNIDIQKEKIVAENIIQAKTTQKKIDRKKAKIVADNILLAQAKSDSRLMENNEWIKYIAKTSYDVMWDWNIATGEIYVGDSLEEVFGYKVDNNTINYKDFENCLLPEEKIIVEKKLLKTLASVKKSWKDSFMLRRQDGTIASITSRASIVRDDLGKAIRLIGAIQDVSKLQELEIRLEEQSSAKQESKSQFAAKFYFDAIWDWNLLTNEFFLGEGFEEFFGYGISNKLSLVDDWRKWLHRDDKDAVEKGLQDTIASSDSHWKHHYRFIRADGSIAQVFGRASVIRQASGKALRMIGAIRDLSLQKDLEDKMEVEMADKTKLLSQYEENFRLIFNSSPDILYDCDLVTNKIQISDAFTKEFGYTIAGKSTPEEDWASHIHPEDKAAVLKDYFRMLSSTDTEWKITYRFIRADKSIANIYSSGIILRDKFGEACRMIVSMHDISKQVILEEKLKQEIQLKEKQIADAMEDAKDTERSDIGKELHDNINQLLGASRLYLELAKRGGENSEMYLSRSSEYTISAIEEIRKLTKSLTTDIIKNLGLSEAIETIIHDTMEVSPVKISSSLDGFMENSVDNKFKLNVFRIVQEQINNILKHAGASEVIIQLLQDKKFVILTISDNGVGFDIHKKQAGIGLKNIKSRAMSYFGTADFVSTAGHGCILKVTFPISDAMFKKV